MCCYLSYNVTEIIEETFFDVLYIILSHLTTIVPNDICKIKLRNLSCIVIIETTNITETPPVGSKYSVANIPIISDATYQLDLGQIKKHVLAQKF